MNGSVYSHCCIICLFVCLISVVVDIPHTLVVVGVCMKMNLKFMVCAFSHNIADKLWQLTYLVYKINTILCKSKVLEIN